MWVKPIKTKPDDGEAFEKDLQKMELADEFHIALRGAMKQEAARDKSTGAAPTQEQLWTTTAKRFGLKEWRKRRDQGLPGFINMEQDFDFDRAARTTDADYFEVVQWVFQHLGCDEEQLAKMKADPPGPAAYMLQMANESPANYGKFMDLHKDCEKFLRQKDNRKRLKEDDRRKQMSIIDEFVRRELEANRKQKKEQAALDKKAGVCSSCGRPLPLNSGETP